MNILEPVWVSVCFNRTFMELKFMNILEPVWVSVCFNRTFMELKSGKPVGERRSCLFQSYLYGIEIAKT